MTTRTRIGGALIAAALLPWSGSAQGQGQGGQGFPGGQGRPGGPGGMGPMQQERKIVAQFDKDGDGTYETSNVFAEGFNTEVTGIAAGTLAWRGDVYATIAPDMWKLRDTDGDGRADSRRVVFSGFGIGDTHHPASLAAKNYKCKSGRRVPKLLYGKLDKFFPYGIVY